MAFAFTQNPDMASECVSSTPRVSGLCAVIVIGVNDSIQVMSAASPESESMN